MGDVPEATDTMTLRKIGFTQELGYGFEDESPALAPRLRARVSAEVISYLERGTLLVQSAPLGHGTRPRGIVTDGHWCWPVELPALVTAQQAVLPDAFVAWVRSHGAPAALEESDLAGLSDELLLGSSLKEPARRGILDHLAWRRSHGARGQRLEAHTLVLDDCHLPLVDLAEADLSGSFLRRVHLDGAQLQGADLSGCRLDNAHLAHAQLGKATVDRAHCEVSNWEHASLMRASFYGTNCQDATFAGAQMTDVGFWKADCGGAHFDETQLEHVTFEDVGLIGATFVGSRSLDTVTWTNVTVSVGLVLSGDDCRRWIEEHPHGG